jgi:hypothetical protein
MESSRVKDWVAGTVAVARYQERVSTNSSMGCERVHMRVRSAADWSRMGKEAGNEGAEAASYMQSPANISAVCLFSLLRCR